MAFDGEISLSAAAISIVDLEPNIAAELQSTFETLVSGANLLALGKEAAP
jgi:hypothetical protein